MRTLLGIRDVVGTVGMVVGAAGLLLGGYMFLMSLPDLRRYIRITSM